MHRDSNADVVSDLRQLHVDCQDYEPVERMSKSSERSNSSTMLISLVKET